MHNCTCMSKCKPQWMGKCDACACHEYEAEEKMLKRENGGESRRIAEGEKATIKTKTAPLGEDA